MLISRLTLDDLYINIFRLKRIYEPDGTIRWEPLQVNRQPTGIKALDHIFQEMSRGNFSLDHIAKQLECEAKDLYGAIKLLTGMKASQFKRAYQLRVADELMRYTELPLDEVAQRCGTSSRQGLNQLYKSMINTTPATRRFLIRKQNDVGRYAL